jgi:hypothetical protein
MAYTFILRDIPALAYSSNPAALLSCQLVIKYHTSRKQAAIFLNLSAHTYGFEHAQLFVLTYNADNLVPGTTFLGPATTDLPQDRLVKVARTNTAAVKILSLTLHAPCPVRCPPSTGCIAPKPGHETHFRQLRDLASATEVRIVFDDNWVHEQHYATLYRLINHPEKLRGLPLENYNGTASRRTDWTVFSPVEDAEAEAPPSYNEVPTKRSRQGKHFCTPASRSLWPWLTPVRSYSRFNTRIATFKTRTHSSLSSTFACALSDRNGSFSIAQHRCRFAD